MVGRPPRVQEVAGSISVRVIPKILKMEVMAALRIAGIALQLTGWFQYKWTRNTGNLSKTFELVNSADPEQTVRML